MHLYDVRDVGAIPARKDIYLEAALTKPSCQLRDVDVETSGIAGARRGQWRGMHADHRDPTGIFHAWVHTHLR
jgi:hypothetical protein